MAERKHKFMKAAFANAHGQFREKAHKAGESTKAFAEEHKHDAGKTGAQARLALVGMKAGKSRAEKRYKHVGVSHGR